MKYLDEMKLLSKEANKLSKLSTVVVKNNNITNEDKLALEKQIGVVLAMVREATEVHELNEDTIMASAEDSYQNLG